MLCSRDRAQRRICVLDFNNCNHTLSPVSAHALQEGRVLLGVHSRLVVDAPLALDRPDLYEEPVGLEMHNVAGLGTDSLDPVAESRGALFVAASHDVELASLVVVKKKDSVCYRNCTRVLGLGLAPLALWVAEYLSHFIEELFELGNAGGHVQLCSIDYGDHTAKAKLAQRRGTLCAHHVCDAVCVFALSTLCLCLVIKLASNPVKSCQILKCFCLLRFDFHANPRRCRQTG